MFDASVVDFLDVSMFIAIFIGEVWWNPYFARNFVDPWRQARWVRQPLIQGFLGPYLALTPSQVTDASPWEVMVVEVAFLMLERNTPPRKVC